MVAPFSKFYGKIWVDFCLNTGNTRTSALFDGAFSVRVSLKQIRCNITVNVDSLK